MSERSTANIVKTPRESKMQESSREKKCEERNSLKKVKRDAVTLGDHRSAKASIYLQKHVTVR